MKIKTQDLTGPALDWAVAKCEGEDYLPETVFDGIGMVREALSDCSGGQPCSTCPDKKACQRGCVRQEEFISTEYHAQQRSRAAQQVGASPSAGGVSGPLVGQPQAMPDLSQLTERACRLIAASHGQASSQAGEYPALVCDYCGALTPDPWHSSGMLHGKMSKHIHSCDACAARGAAKAQGFRDGVASLSASAPAPSEHIKEPYTLAEIKAKIASNDYSAEMLLQHAMLLLDSASISANAGEPVAIRPDIQAVLAMLDVPVIARMSSHEGKLLKPGQEPPAFESAVPLVREWDHRRACESIIAALSRNK